MARQINSLIISSTVDAPSRTGTRCINTVRLEDLAIPAIGGSTNPIVTIDMPCGLDPEGGDPDAPQFDPVEDQAISALRPVFVADLPARVVELLNLCSTGSVLALRQLIHQIKGAAGVFGFIQFMVVAASIHDRLESGHTVQDVAVDVEQLVGLIRSIEGYDRCREHFLPDDEGAK